MTGSADILTKPRLPPNFMTVFASMGFTEQRSFPLPVSLGLFGAGCHEFVFQKI